MQTRSRHIYATVRFLAIFVGCLSFRADGDAAGWRQREQELHRWAVIAFSLSSGWRRKSTITRNMLNKETRDEAKCEL